MCFRYLSSALVIICILSVRVEASKSTKKASPATPFPMSPSVSPFGINGINNTSPPLRLRRGPSTQVPSLPVVLAPQTPVLTHTEMTSVDALSDSMAHMRLSKRNESHVRGQLLSKKLYQYGLDVKSLSNHFDRPEVRRELREKTGELKSYGVECFQQAKPRDFALLVNGFSNVYKLPDMEEITDVLMLVATEVSKRSAQDLTLSQWSAEHLAMVGSGLSRAEGGEVQRALLALAKALKYRSLTADLGWSAEYLAMVAKGLTRAMDGNGFSRGEWVEIQKALGALAKEVNDRVLTTKQGWYARELVLMVEGLSRGEGEEIQKALIALAKEVEGRVLTPEQGWYARELALMVEGLSWGEGEDIQKA